YYENIIPAIMKDDNDSEKINHINNILKAFEFSKSPQNRFLIINSFETVIAIYFINKSILQLILRDPESYDFNMVQIHDWPDNFATPIEKFRADRKVNLITYEGKMSKETKEDLKKRIPQIQHQNEIEDLYEQSNLAPLEDMIL
ncbi:MAG TPA: hypothetical protein VIH57_13800, partial [Bacteroidales bacterium]